MLVETLSKSPEGKAYGRTKVHRAQTNGRNLDTRSRRELAVVAQQARRRVEGLEHGHVVQRM